MEVNSGLIPIMSLVTDETTIESNLTSRLYIRHLF